jgi:hypothetical protein
LSWGWKPVVIIDTSNRRPSGNTSCNDSGHYKSRYEGRVCHPAITRIRISIDPAAWRSKNRVSIRRKNEIWKASPIESQTVDHDSS